MNTTYPITNEQLRADAEITRTQSFAGVPHSGTIKQTERLYVPHDTDIVVDFGKQGELKFSLGEVPALPEMVTAAIRRTASYRQMMAERKTKAEPVFIYKGRPVKKTEQKKLEPKYPKYSQPRPGMA